MSMFTLKFWLSLLIVTIVFLGFGRYFDRKCRGGCLREVLLTNFEDSAKIFGENPRQLRRSQKVRIAAAKVVDIPFDKAKVQKLTIKSFVTNWVIRQRGESLGVSYSGYRAPEEWSIQDAGDSISIETRKKGPQRAEIDLPHDFSGELELINVSGEVLFEGFLQLKMVKVTNVSGLVTMQELPRERLELSTVTGSIVATQNKNLDPLAIEVQSVSGDIDLRLKANFSAMHVESVSGSVFLHIPERSSFNFRLESVSGNFSGFPLEAEESREFGEKDLEGTVGSEASAVLHFETISGEFQLMQDRIDP